jgi:hypothetical protein
MCWVDRCDHDYGCPIGHFVTPCTISWHVALSLRHHTVRTHTHSPSRALAHSTCILFQCCAETPHCNLRHYRKCRREAKHQPIRASNELLMQAHIPSQWHLWQAQCALCLHWPYRIQGRLIENLVWFSRPAVACLPVTTIGHYGAASTHKHTASIILAHLGKYSASAMHRTPHMVV